jgi:hypothetical protein
LFTLGLDGSFIAPEACTEDAAVSVSMSKIIVYRFMEESGKGFPKQICRDAILQGMPRCWHRGNPSLSSLYHCWDGGFLKS